MSKNQAIGSMLSNYQKVSTTLPASIEAVDLTPEELQAAINEAKSSKYFRLQDEQKKIDKQNKLAEFARPWTTEETAHHAKKSLIESLDKQKKQLEMDANFQPVFELLAAYFSEAKSFEINNPGFSLERGLLLMGPVGTGKTEILKAFKKNKARCFFPVSANDIEASIRDKGLAYWKTYCGYVPGHGYTDGYFQQSNIGWMIDDLGTEEVVRDYGNTLDCLDKIIQERYMHSDQIPYNALHMTTNLTEQALTERYGQRFVSRLYDMFNIIVLNGKDRRKG